MIDKNSMEKLRQELKDKPKEYLDWYRKKTDTYFKRQYSDLEKNMLELDRLIITVSSGTLAFLAAYTSLEDHIIFWNMWPFILVLFFSLGFSILLIVISYMLSVKQSSHGVLGAKCDEIAEELSTLNKLNEETAIRLSNEIESQLNRAEQVTHYIEFCNKWGQCAFLIGIVSTLLFLPVSLAILGGKSEVAIYIEKHFSFTFFVFIFINIAVAFLHIKFIFSSFLQPPLSNQRKIP